MTEAGHRRQLRSASSCAMRSTDSTTSARIPCSTDSWARTRSRASCGTRSFPTSTSSASAGRRLRHRSPKSTSPARCCAAVCSPWRAAGGAVGVRTHCSPASPEINTIIGLICFGLALRAHGWRITYLGADTPLPTLIETADLLQPALVVVSAALPELTQSALGGLRELACVAPLALAGRGTDASITDTVGARWLNEDPVAAAASTAAPRADANRMDN